MARTDSSRAVLWFSVIVVIVLILPLFTPSTASLQNRFEPYFGKFAGSLKDFAGHGIRGELFVVNQNAIFLANFTYDGLGTGMSFTTQNPPSADTSLD